MLDSLQAGVTLATAVVAVALSYYSVRVSGKQHLESSRIEARTQLNDIERSIARLVNNSSVPGKHWVSLSSGDLGDLRLLLMQADKTVRNLPSNDLSPVELADLSLGFLWVFEHSLAKDYMYRAVALVSSPNKVTPTTKAHVLAMSATLASNLGDVEGARKVLSQVMEMIDESGLGESGFEYNINLLIRWAFHAMAHANFDEARALLEQASEKADMLTTAFRQDRARSRIADGMSTLEKDQTEALNKGGAKTAT